MSWLNAPSGKKEDRLPVRVSEHSALVPGPDGEGEVSETCTLITTLLMTGPSRPWKIMQAYLTRWSASETTFGENKATITGAGNRTSGRCSAPAARSSSSRSVGGLTGTQLVRASEAAALRGGEAAARALRRKDAKPVTADEESFTAARHHATPLHGNHPGHATSSLAALAAAEDAAARACLHTLNIPGRERHSPRVQKARPKFGHTSATKTTLTGKHEVIVYAPGRC